MLKGKIVYDDTPENPREWCNLGTLALHGSLGHLSDEYWKSGDLRREMEGLAESVDPDVDIYDSDLEDLLDVIRREYYICPVYAYSHGNVTLSTSPFSCPWDSGLCGIIWISKEDAKNHAPEGEDPEKWADKVMEEEIETLSAFVNGDVYGFQVFDSEGEEVDSCFGFYSEEEAKQNAEWNNGEPIEWEEGVQL